MEYVQLAVPMGLIIWLAIWPLKGRARWAHAAAVVAVVVLMGLVGQWGWPSAYAPYGVLGLGLLAAVFGRRRSFGRGERGGWIGGCVMLAVAGLAVAGVVVAVKARVRPAEVVALDSPVAGAALVTQGGGQWFINGLQAVLDENSPSLTSWKGAGAGVELVAADGWGRETGAALQVVAPCAGHVVLVAQDARLGQAVVLECAGVWVVLGGMDEALAEGDVAVGAVLGQSSRLTVHAQTPGVAAHPFSGDALAVTLGERYAVRGMLLGGIAALP